MNDSQKQLLILLLILILCVVILLFLVFGKVQCKQPGSSTTKFKLQTKKHRSGKLKMPLYCSSCTNVQTQKELQDVVDKGSSDALSQFCNDKTLVADGSKLQECCNSIDTCTDQKSAGILNTVAQKGGATALSSYCSSSSIESGSITDTCCKGINQVCEQIPDPSDPTQYIKQDPDPYCIQACLGEEEGAY